MPTPPASLIPANDEERLQELRRYQLLDATNERIFDELAALTARLFQTPISLISLVGKEEVEFPGNFGLADAGPVPRNLSLCSAAILQEVPTVYEDLKSEPCQLTDPTIAQQLNLQFYAGHPLRTPNGHNIGTLCIIDHRPRSFTPAEQGLLQVLAGVVMHLLELRTVLHAKQESSFKFWDPVYTAIGGQLRRLQALADEAAATRSTQLPAPIAKEASAVAGIIDQYIQATLARV